MTKLLRKPELSIDDNGKEISTRIGQYSNNVTVQLATKHQGKIVSVRDIVRVQFGRVTNRNEQYVRGKISAAVNMLLKAGIPAFPLYEDKGHHRVLGIKVLTEYSDADLACLVAYQDIAVKRGELSLAKAEQIKRTVEALKES